MNLPKVERLALPDVLLITPRRFGDDRGYFSETWSAKAFAEAGLDVVVVQDNHSKSARKGTLRGLHYQAPPHPQGKLVRVVAGAVWDVVVDWRKGSPDFGKWVGAELSAENGAQLYAPPGFLHGFCTLREDTEVVYKVTDYYSAECDGSVAWDSPELGIDWRLDGPPVLSAKDQTAKGFSETESPFVFGDRL